jgi:hypothetical protein
MLTQEQKATIGGTSTFEFETTVGVGLCAVIVRMTYEYDSSGIYNETIDTVRNHSGWFILDYLTEETIDDLCLQGCTMISQLKMEY